MKKAQLFILKFGISLSLICLVTSNILAQNPVVVAFEDSSSIVKEPVDTVIIHLVKLNISNKDTLKHPIEVEVEIEYSTSSATYLDYELVEEKVVLSNSIRSGYVHIKIKPDSRNEGREQIKLKIKENPKEFIALTEGDNPKNIHTLYIDNALKITSPGALLIGTNFDFIDGAKATNLYYDLNLSFQDIMDYGWFQLGLEAGIKQNRTISQDTTGNNGMITHELLSGSFDEPDSVLVLESTFEIEKYQIDYQSFYFQPTILLHKNLSENNLFGLLHGEILQKKYTITRDLQSLEVDTLTRLPERGTFLTREMPNPTKVSTHQVNLGVGLMYFHQSQDLRAVIKGIVGRNFEQDRNEYFYLINLDITEQKSLVQLGAEIRGGDSFEPFNGFRAQTTFSIYLAKKFPLNKIVDLFSSE